MWWPRPRWKNDDGISCFALLTSSLLLLIVATGLTMADEEAQQQQQQQQQQRCAGGDASAVVWTAALCMVLLVLIVVAIYFVYCRRKAHDWSSLWWKNNSDKNLVLQTSAPTKDYQLKNGGTDNPAFLPDAASTDSRVPVVSAGSTRIVCVPSTAIDSGSLGIELSATEEGGKTVYVCEHDDGSKGRLASLRLVFDGEQKSAGPHLGRALVELCREYGLRVELATEARAAEPSAVGPPHLHDELTASKRDGGAKSKNLLSAVRGKAQSLWDRRRFAIGGGDEAAARDAGDVESGPAVPASVPPPSEGGVVPSTAVQAMTVDETRGAGRGSVRYRTLEYGASAADAERYASAEDDGVQRCSINPPAPEPPLVAVEVAATQRSAVQQPEEEAAVQQPRTAATPEPPHEERKNAPPPPPRKYSVPTVVPSAAATATATRANSAPAMDVVVTVTSAAAALEVAPLVAPAATDSEITPIAVVPAAAREVPATAAREVSPLAARATENEIRIDDDYYWCTTTAMASPAMSTFGKRRDDGMVAENGEDAVQRAGGTTASIEDASLPFFSSEDEEEADDADDKNDVTLRENGRAAFAPDEKTEEPVDEQPRGVERIGRDDSSAAAKTGSCNGELLQQAAAVVAPVATATEPTKSVATTRLPTLRLSLSSPPQSTASSPSSTSFSSSSSSSTSSSPTNNGGTGHHAPIVSKIPVRRQSAGSGGGTPMAATSNGTAKKSIPLPLSRSGSRLAMWSSAN